MLTRPSTPAQDPPEAPTETIDAGGLAARHRRDTTGLRRRDSTETLRRFRKI